MTLADPRIKARSWLDALKGASEGSAEKPEWGERATGSMGWDAGQKLPGDMADLIVMSTVDEKAPPVNPGGADLLDTLVQEHLERAGDAIAEPPAGLASAEALPETISDEVRVSMLQREIETLLRDTGEVAPVVEETVAAPELPVETQEQLVPAAVDPAEMQADVVTTEAQVPADIPKAVLLSNPPPSPQEVQQPDTTIKTAISRAELDTLLLENAPAAEITPSVSMASAQGIEGSLVSESETNAKLSDAEKLVAAELSVLTAELPATPVEKLEKVPVSATELATEQSLSEAEGVLAEELSQLMADSEPKPAAEAPVPQPAPADAPIAPEKPPLMTSAEQVAAELRVDEAAARTNANPLPPPPAVIPPAPDPAVQEKSPDASVVAEHFEEDAEAPSQQRGRLRRLTGDLALMVAQLIDLPFGWIDELNKNVIGMAAFLLLLGGVVMWILARMTGS
jgi:hypothetical protein